MAKNGLFGTSFFGKFPKKVPVLFTKALVRTVRTEREDVFMGDKMGKNSLDIKGKNESDKLIPC